MRVRAAAVAMIFATTLAACQGNVFDLAEGTCFDDTGAGDEISDVPIVECEEPHDNEVYATIDMPDGDFPGDAAIEAAAEEGCLGEFDGWAGIAYAESRLFVSYLAPTEASWDELDDREIVCYVFDGEAQKLTGSMQGSGV